MPKLQPDIFELRKKKIPALYCLEIHFIFNLFIHHSYDSIFIMVMILTVSAIPRHQLDLLDLIAFGMGFSLRYMMYRPVRRLYLETTFLIISLLCK